MDNVVKIGLLGAGTIGGSVIEVLQNNRDIITQRANTAIEIKKILVLPREIPALQERGLPATNDYDEILNDPEIKIVVELMGGVKPAKDFILQASLQTKMSSRNSGMNSSTRRTLIKSISSSRRQSEEQFRLSCRSNVP